MTLKAEDTSDYQNLNVRVPRKTMVQVAELKKALKIMRSDVVIDAIEQAHNELMPKEKKTITSKVSTKL